MTTKEYYINFREKNTDDNWEPVDNWFYDTYLKALEKLEHLKNIFRKYDFQIVCDEDGKTPVVIMTTEVKIKYAIDNNTKEIIGIGELSHGHETILLTQKQHELVQTIFNCWKGDEKNAFFPFLIDNKIVMMKKNLFEKMIILKNNKPIMNGEINNRPVRPMLDVGEIDNQFNPTTGW